MKIALQMFGKNYNITLSENEAEIKEELEFLLKKDQIDPKDLLFALVSKCEENVRMKKSLNKIIKKLENN